MMMTRPRRLIANIWLSLLSIAMVTACGQGPVGPDEDAVLGVWVLDSDQPLNQIAYLSDTRISYEEDGQSSYQAQLRITEPDAPVSTMVIQADVRWSLEETILTRELQSVEVTPVTEGGSAPTQAQLDYAQAYEDGFDGSPPAQFIVEAVNDAQLVLIDPVSGDMLAFNRAPELQLRN